MNDSSGMRAPHIESFTLDSDTARPFRGVFTTEISPIIDQLREVFRSARLYLIGGTLRRAARQQIEGIVEPLNDVDIIVDTNDDMQCSVEALGGQLLRNFFGGLRWHPEGFLKHVDLWRLRDQYNIVHFSRQPTIQAAMVGFPFNLERAAIDLRDEVVYDGGCLRGITERTIRFDPLDLYLEHIQAARALSLRRRTGYTFHHSVLQLISSRPWLGREAEVLEFLFANGHSAAQGQALLAELVEFKLVAPEV